MENINDACLSVKLESCNDQILLHIEDNGVGIAEEHLNEIFNPLFTTKLSSKDENEQGTGLGLSFCKKMIESYNGTIAVSSKVGQGTCFVISLPMAKEKVA